MIKIGDLGLGRDVSSRTAAGCAKTAAGTASYMYVEPFCTFSKPEKGISRSFIHMNAGEPLLRIAGAQRCYSTDLTTPGDLS